MEPPALRRGEPIHQKARAAQVIPYESNLL